MRPGRLPALASLALATCAVPSAPQPTWQAVRAATLDHLLPGHFIDERPYPCDAGPTLLRSDGGYEVISGWARHGGRYAIADGTLTLRPTEPYFPPQRLRFVRDRRGLIFYLGPDDHVPRALFLAAIEPASSQLIGCTGAPNAAPAAARQVRVPD